MSKKRIKEDGHLSKEEYEAKEEEESGGGGGSGTGFEKASADVLSARKILKVRRGPATSDASGGGGGAPAPAGPNPFANFTFGKDDAAGSSGGGGGLSSGLGLSSGGLSGGFSSGLGSKPATAPSSFSTTTNLGSLYGSKPATTGPAPSSVGLGGGLGFPPFSTAQPPSSSSTPNGFGGFPSGGTLGKPSTTTTTKPLDSLWNGPSSTSSTGPPSSATTQPSFTLPSAPAPAPSTSSIDNSNWFQPNSSSGSSLSNGLSSGRLAGPSNPLAPSAPSVPLDLSKPLFPNSSVSVPQPSTSSSSSSSSFTRPSTNSTGLTAPSAFPTTSSSSQPQPSQPSRPAQAPAPSRYGLASATPAPAPAPAPASRRQSVVPQPDPAKLKLKMTELNKTFLQYVTTQLPKNPYSTWDDGIKDYMSYVKKLEGKYGKPSGHAPSSSSSSSSSTTTTSTMAAPPPRASLTQTPMALPSPVAMDISAQKPTPAPPTAKPATSSQPGLGGAWNLGVGAPSTGLGFGQPSTSTNGTNGNPPVSFGLPTPAAPSAPLNLFNTNNVPGTPLPPFRPQALFTTPSAPTPTPSAFGNSQGGGGGGASAEPGDDDDAMPHLAPEVAQQGEKDPNEVFSQDPVKVNQFNKEDKTWKDMGKGTLRLYQHHETPHKRWLAVRNIMGKVTLTSGIVPGMKFERDDKGSSVSFICKPVKDDGTVSDFVRLNIKVKKGTLDALLAKLNELAK